MRKVIIFRAAIALGLSLVLLAVNLALLQIPDLREAGTVVACATTLMICVYLLVIDRFT